MHARTLVSVGILLMLVGCATPYVEPAGSDTATLSFQNYAFSDVGIQGFSVATDCSGGKVTFNQKTRLLPQEKMEIKVKANQAFSFFFNHSVGMKYCLMPATFTPKQGEKYVARFTADENSCYVGVLTTTAVGETKDPTFKLRKWRTPFSESGSFCE